MKPILPLTLNSSPSTPPSPSLWVSKSLQPLGHQNLFVVQRVGCVSKVLFLSLLTLLPLPTRCNLQYTTINGSLLLKKKKHKDKISNIFYSICNSLMTTEYIIGYNFICIYNSTPYFIHIIYNANSEVYTI